MLLLLLVRLYRCIAFPFTSLFLFHWWGGTSTGAATSHIYISIYNINIPTPLQYIQMGKWSTKKHWAMTYFDMVPSPSASASPAPLLPSVDRQSDKQGLHKCKREAKRLKTLLQNGQTRWRCRRCSALLQPPVEKSTGRPQYGVMMAEHLEGISCSGTDCLATGVEICTAGIIRYEEDSAREARRPAAATAATDTIKEDEDEKCRQQLRSLFGRRRGTVEPDAEPKQKQADVRVFVVVENPKTPANAGGILRAMRCYGVTAPPGKRTREPDGEDGGGSGESPLCPGLSSVGGAFIYSGTRLNKALQYRSPFSPAALNTDTLQGSHTIPQISVSSLDLLFHLLRDEHGHRPSLVQRHGEKKGRRVWVVAVELIQGATPLPLFIHPHSSPASSGNDGDDDDDDDDDGLPRLVFYLFGSEDGTLSENYLRNYVDDVVFIPTLGSMNLAATVNVLLYDRLSKHSFYIAAAERRREKTDGSGDHQSHGVVVQHDDLRGSGSVEDVWKAVFDTRNSNNRLHI